MSAPIIRRMSAAEAEQELRTLEAEVGGSIEEFEQRARCYDLSSSERSQWQRINDLRWLLGRV